MLSHYRLSVEAAKPAIAAKLGFRDRLAQVNRVEIMALLGDFKNDHRA